MSVFSIRLSGFLLGILSCVLPFSSGWARLDPALADPVLENVALPDYHYSPDGNDTPEAYLSMMNVQEFTGVKPGSSRETKMRRQTVNDIIRDNPDMPEYMKKAYRAYQETGDRNIRRFAQAASEFQKQELREQLVQHIDDPEKMNRLMAALYGKPYGPYKPVGKSGYVVNQETGEISPGNKALAGAYRQKLAASAVGKKSSSRKRVHTRSRTYREDRHGDPSHEELKEEYLLARRRAVTANRNDLVEELDKMARKNGYFD